jgi:hypothetical protein
MKGQHITEFKMMKYKSRGRWLIVAIADDMKGNIEIDVLENHPDLKTARKSLALLLILAKSLRGDIARIMKHLDETGCKFRPKISK